ncbi:NAD(P)-dependent oxidoreductase [Phytohalomonas tamaricis]|uniref:NAD(P)-dependent oxidoreductase n=1 Tax=Phytohalomonas tamaricis TaxID=2081032 RepID=UPI000D0AC699|nr:NAD(P)H-binding protein [Phytohalomonas tamaricis]
MNIVLLGATGFVGSALLKEALQRGHWVTAISRSAGKLDAHPNLTPVEVDINDVATLTSLFVDRDAIIHAYAPPKSESIARRIEQQTHATQTIITALKHAGVKRILAVGGAGTLKVAGGGYNMDRPDFPREYEGGVKSTKVVKELLEQEPGLEWTSLSPAHEIFSGERTGKFRLGLDDMIVDNAGISRISVEDFAVAMIDELETPRHTHRRFTVGY